MRIAGPGQVWIADRHFCTRTLLAGWDEAQASFIVREHAKHPRLASQRDWRCCGRADTGTVHEQEITLEGSARLWTNLPAWVSAAQVATLYRRRWGINIDQAWRLSRIKGCMVNPSYGFFMGQTP
jgi:IS4 transposase